MRCVTWSRDSHGLFDYESRYIAKKNIKSQQQGKIIRLNNDVEFVPIETNLENISAEARPLLSLKYQNDRFYVINDTLNLEPTVDDPSNQMYIVVRNMKAEKEKQEDPAIDKKPFSGEYRISKGDTIKMGRLKFSVKDFRTDSHIAHFDNEDGSPVKGSHRLELADDEEFAEEEEVEIECGIADSSEIQCKVCWGDE